MRFASSVLPTAAVLASFATSAVAQTFTKCNPLNTTNCPADPALGTNVTFNYNNSHINGDLWTSTPSLLNYETNGVQFIINEEGDAPEIISKFYIFGGRVETIMKSAPGQGIVSCIVLESDDLDEVDLEIIGGNTTFGENNYYSKGNESARNAIWFPMDPPPQEAFHNYTTLWTEDALQWWVDGQMVRELLPQDAYGGPNTYPQTPMTIRVGTWAGGASDQPGTVAWAGGKTDFSDGPFVMTLQYMYIEDFGTGASYTYDGESGAWGSIANSTGHSEAYNVVHAKSIGSDINNLSPAVKLGIAVGVLSIVAVAMAVSFFCCMRMRRAGHRERLIADAAFEKEAADNMAMRAQLAREQADWKRMQAGVTEVTSTGQRGRGFGGYL